MFRLAVRSLIDKKLRFALTTFVVMLGVMFVVGSFTLTDSLRSTFAGLAGDIAQGADLTVRVDQSFGGDFDRATVPEAVGEQVLSVEGVDRIQPELGTLNVFIVDGDGEPIRPPGPPALGFNFNPGTFFVVEGRPPVAPGEFAADTSTVSNNGLLIGETYQINGPLYAETFQLVGVFNFGTPDSHTGLGQTMAAFELEEAQRFFGMEDGYMAISVLVSADADVSDVQDRLEAELGDDYRVITQEVDAAEQEEDFNQVISIFNTILLVFAFIALFVAAFIINNTFQIIIGQRVREIGLWRAIGATPRQVSQSVITESAIVGIVSTVIGIGLGLVLAVVLRAILDLIGFPLPPGPLLLRPRTVGLAMLVGLGVTMVSSIAPAVSARRISPVAALSHDFQLDATSLRRRLIAGGTVFAAGVVALAAGMTAGLDPTPTFVLLGIGAVLAFVGINTVSPAFAGPVSSMLGRPVQALFGLPGRLGRDNASRNPRRTASTAGALLIGLALIGLAAVVGESMKKTFVNILDNAVEADYFIQSPVTGFGPPPGFPAQVADEIEALDEIESVMRVQFSFSGLSVDGEPRDIVAADLALADDHFDGQVISGNMATGDPLTSLALHSDSALSLGVGVGDTIEATFPDNQTETLTVVAIYEDAAIYGNWLIDGALWDRHFNRNELAFASARIAGLSDAAGEAEQAALQERSRAAVEGVLERYPTVKVENQAEFRQTQESQLSAIIRIIQLLIGLSFVIALIGIINTLSLSVFERIHEIGLLRSVGMTRKQLRRSIYWEALIVAVFGGLLGVTVGTVFGVATTLALPESFVQVVAVPWLDLVVFVVISAVAGLLAAILPAVRAGRMNILDAIAHE
ncbi:MAG: ABC transporter permease [Acidimicrobiaceae bacterium]|nr:ABC transporter permease [Acidimicrobiaceae bacterium]MYF41787.1 ABC transporter permease [Acidimicrobiaceae bacterium]